MLKSLNTPKPYFVLTSWTYKQTLNDNYPLNQQLNCLFNVDVHLK